MIMNDMSYDEIREMLGQTALVAKSNTESTAVVLKRLEAQETLINGISKTVDSLNSNMGVMNDRMDKFEYQIEITTTQVEDIKRNARRRVYEILGGDDYEHEKYYRTFIGRLYSDTRKFAGLGSKIDRTRKGDYQRCMDYIEGWTPTGGSKNLKDEIDKKAKARKKAKKNGYVA